MRRALHQVLLCCGIAAAVLLTGCDRPPSRFTVMSYNVHRYTNADRDGDGTADEPKPVVERAAVIGLIAAERPDVLTLQEMGNAMVFAQFRDELRRAGLAYSYADLLVRGRGDLNLAVLSRFPFAAVRHHTNEWYSIGEAQVPVSRGFLDVDLQVTPSYRLRLLAAHLKSKVYHPLGQTEMRRNEARLLNKTVRGILEENPDVNLLVAGDMNDHYGSAPLREVAGRRGGRLTDLRPVDDAGDVWTVFMESTDEYCRFDYLFVSDGLLPEVSTSWVVRDPRTYQASDHRPVIAEFIARENPAAD